METHFHNAIGLVLVAMSLRHADLISPSLTYVTQQYATHVYRCRKFVACAINKTIYNCFVVMTVSNHCIHPNSNTLIFK